MPAAHRGLCSLAPLSTHTPKHERLHQCQQAGQEAQQQKKVQEYDQGLENRGLVCSGSHLHSQSPDHANSLAVKSTAPHFASLTDHPATKIFCPWSARESSQSQREGFTGADEVGGERRASYIGCTCAMRNHSPPAQQNLQEPERQQVPRNGQ